MCSNNNNDKIIIIIICNVVFCNLVLLSCLNANEMLIFVNDLLYLRHGKAQKLNCLTAFVLRV